MTRCCNFNGQVLESCASASSATPASLIINRLAFQPVTICYVFDFYAVRLTDIDTSVEVARDHAVRFVAVTDSRKRKIRGLWKHGDRYYAQMRMEVEGGQTKPKRIALSATTLDQAREELMAFYADVIPTPADQVPAGSPVIQAYEINREWAQNPDSRQKRGRRCAEQDVRLE